MKKRLSLLMVMMMTLSLLPFSAFAAKENYKIEVPGGVQEFNALDENQPVSIMVDLGDKAILKRGQVEINLKNARTADMKNPVTAKFVRDGKQVGLKTIVGFEDKFDARPLRGGEKRFVMRFTGEDLNELGESKTKLMITFNLDFSESVLGDVDVSFEDLSETGFGSLRDTTIADFVDGMQRDMLVKIKDNTARIGEYGGSLSEFTITRFDTLDSIRSNNEIKVILPSSLEFDKSTKVTADGKNITPVYSKLKNQMTINGVDSKTSSLTILPYVNIVDSKVPYGQVQARVEFIKSGKTVNSKSFEIGNITDNAIKLEVLENGKDRIAQLNSGESKEVQITLDGIRGSFAKGDYVDFKIEGIDVVYDSIKTIHPKGQINLKGESQGNSKSDLVNGKQVYKNREFSMKILDTNVEKITFEMDITADMLQSGKAYISANSKNFKSSKTDLADISSTVTVDTKMSIVQKGTMFKSGDIIIKESNSGSLNTGDKLHFALDKQAMGFDVSTLKVNATAGVELSAPRTNKDGTMELEVLRKSYNAASKIVISGIKAYSSEDVIGGVAKLEIKLNDKVIYETDYIKVVGEVANSTVFTIGDKTYTANNQKKQSVEAPYIKSGYTMLPVRAVAEALGLSSNWDNTNKIATFANDKKTAIVKLGGKEIIVNGTPIKLSVPAEVKNGTTMIELRSLATGFNVNIQWNNNLKTATVTAN